MSRLALPLLAPTPPTLFHHHLLVPERTKQNLEHPDACFFFPAGLFIHSKMLREDVCVFVGAREEKRKEVVKNK